MEKPLTQAEMYVVAAYIEKLAAERNNNDAYSGSFSSSGGDRLLEIASAWRCGMAGRLPENWLDRYAPEALKAADPEYKEYLRLKTRFE